MNCHLILFYNGSKNGWLRYLDDENVPYLRNQDKHAREYYTHVGLVLTKYVSSQQLLPSECHKVVTVEEFIETNGTMLSDLDNFLA